MENLSALIKRPMRIQIQIDVPKLLSQPDVAHSQIKLLAEWKMSDKRGAGEIKMYLALPN